MSNGRKQEQAVVTQVTQQQEEKSALDTIIKETGLGRDREQDYYSRHQIITVAQLVEEVMQGTERVPKKLEATIKQRIAEIDELLSAQLNEVLHAPEFQKLEASWRGLHYLVHQSETSPNLKIKVLNVSKEDLYDDLTEASDHDQSGLFKKVYSAEYDTFRGTPFGVLIGDYEFSRPQDIQLLEKISNVAAMAHAPFIGAASPQLFGMESFTQIGDKRDLAMIFDSPEYAKWTSFRESEDSRYVGLTLPHMLMRLPYGPDTTPVRAFHFKEDVDGKDHRKYLWGNAAYAFGARLTDAFAKYGWCTAILGPQGGGLVEDLPLHIFKTDEGAIAQKSPTEITLTERQENQLAELGFISLVHGKETDYAAFFSAYSCQKPKTYGTDAAANANARLSTRLQYLMAVSRFAHYIKSIMRDQLGTFMSRQECETKLHTWIQQYVLNRDEAGQWMKAERPLREARVEVSEVPGKPGVYQATAFLKPHYQLEALDVTLSLVAELPQSQGK
jgi:type VI secretion system protein ImpC